MLRKKYRMPKVQNQLWCEAPSGRLIRNVWAWGEELMKRFFGKPERLFPIHGVICNQLAFFSHSVCLGGFLFIKMWLSLNQDRQWCVFMDTRFIQFTFVLPKLLVAVNACSLMSAIISNYLLHLGNNTSCLNLFQRRFSTISMRYQVRKQSLILTITVFIESCLENAWWAQVIFLGHKELKRTCFFSVCVAA